MNFSFIFSNSYEKSSYHRLEKIEILDVEKEDDSLAYSLYKSKDKCSVSPQKPEPEETKKNNPERKNKFIAKTKEDSRSLVSCKSSSQIRGPTTIPTISPTKSPLSPLTKKARFDSFEILRLLGSGTFGKVFLVRKKDDHRIFAMKVLKKKDLIFKKHLKYAVTESNILKKCAHPFILRIHYSFQVIPLKTEVLYIKRRRNTFIW